MPKKSIIITIITVIILIGIAVIFYYYDQHKKDTDIKAAQTKITDSFKEDAFDTAYNATVSSSANTNSSSSANTSTLRGTLDKSLNFQGDILSKEIVVQNIIKVGDKVYTKSPREEKWLIQQNPTFLSQINMMSHPEYIELQKRLSDDKDGNSTYSIIYNQISKAFSDKLAQTQKNGQAGYQLTGTVTLDKQTGQLKQLKINQGTETTNEITIIYTPNATPPTITEPKI